MNSPKSDKTTQEEYAAQLTKERQVNAETVLSLIHKGLSKFIGTTNITFETLLEIEHEIKKSILQYYFIEPYLLQFRLDVAANNPSSLNVIPTNLYTHLFFHGVFAYYREVENKTSYTTPDGWVYELGKTPRKDFGADYSWPFNLNPPAVNRDAEALKKEQNAAYWQQFMGMQPPPVMPVGYKAPDLSFLGINEKYAKDILAAEDKEMLKEMLKGTGIEAPLDIFNGDGMTHSEEVSQDPMEVTVSKETLQKMDEVILKVMDSLTNMLYPPEVLETLEAAPAQPPSTNVTPEVVSFNWKEPVERAIAEEDAKKKETEPGTSAGLPKEEYTDRYAQTYEHSPYLDVLKEKIKEDADSDLDAALVGLLIGAILMGLGMVVLHFLFG
jgi:hypothetical protein